MKFSENWLRALVDLKPGRDELLRRLTLSGLEVAGADTIGSKLAGVVVARIVACEPHPDADRLRVCRVATGQGEVQIVCGAPNARAGLVAPLATVGAVLPNGINIKPAKLRGVESQGMLCSAKELGIDADASGLMELPEGSPIGTPLAEYLGLPDAAIEIELTPNRGDCLGMLGLASEVAAECGAQVHPFEVPAVAATISAPRAIRLDAAADCPRYLGRAVRGIDVAARTPAWMAQRLRAAGVNPINVVVDVTNYVMLETGQPMHAFDEASLAGEIVVRRARDGETLKLLDGSDATLDPSFLVIADAARSLAVAGVMGGLDSRVTDATRDIFFEAAHFAPAVIAGRARKLGLATDAAFRFERGVDPVIPRVAMERATGLLIGLAGGSAGEVIEAVASAYLPVRAPILLRRARIARVLGVAIDDGEVGRILAALGMMVDACTDGWRVTPPSRRFDLEREEDLLEELARIHGYNAIPTGLPAGAPPAPHDDESTLSVDHLGEVLATRGYHEAVCYAFVDPALLQAWQLEHGAVPLANPLSTDLAVMRTSLLPGLVAGVQRNRNRQQERVRLFETGVVFARAAEAGAAPIETAMLAGACCGNARAEQWGESRRVVDFFDAKGDLEALLALSGSPEAWWFDAGDLPIWLHPGRGARVLREGVAVGAIGALHPALLRRLDAPETFVFEVRLDALRGRRIATAAGLPKFPAIRRDIAIEIDTDAPWSRVESAIRTGAPELLKNVILFDDFRGPGVSSGRKSLAIGLILQDESRTLTDADADSSVAAVIELLARDFGARLRG